MKRLKHRIDPDPFGIIVSAAAIIAGVESAIRLYRILERPTPAKRYVRINGILAELKDHLRYANLDLEVLQDVIREADLPGDRAFRPGNRFFLTRSQFGRYDRATDRLLGRLRKILKATHRLDRAVPDMPALDQVDLARQLSQFQVQLDRLIRDREQSIDEALEGLITAIGQVNQLIIDSLEQLGEHGSI